jgi:hypothetical protein
MTFGDVGLDEVLAPVAFDLFDNGLFGLHVVFHDVLGTRGAWTWLLDSFLSGLLGRSLAELMR